MVAPQSIANPNSAFGLPLSGTNIGGAVVMTNDAIYLEVVNNSGGTRQLGDVVVTDVTGLLASTSTTLGDVTVLGVVAQVNGAAIPSGANMIVQIRGVARVKVVNTVAISANTPLQVSVTAGSATGNATAITVANAAGTFAVALEAFGAADTTGCIRAKLI